MYILVSTHVGGKIRIRAYKQICAYIYLIIHIYIFVSQVYAYILIYKYTNIRIYIRIDTEFLTFAQIGMYSNRCNQYVCICTYVHINTYICVYQKHINMCVFVDIQISMYIQVYRICEYMLHVNVYTYTYIYMYVYNIYIN